jgi:hypothetical protein
LCSTAATNIPLLYLVLGCFGREEGGFVSCTGVENSILTIKPTINNYNEIMNYLDSCQLFDKTLLEYNSVRHIILNLQDKFDQVVKKLWTEKQFRLYQKFIIDHRDCGVYLKLKFTQEQEKSDSNKPV